MNLLKSTGTFGFYTIISRLLGYLRDILIAIFLGTGMLADAFFVAFRIPNTFRKDSNAYQRRHMFDKRKYLTYDRPYEKYSRKQRTLSAIVTYLKNTNFRQEQYAVL